MIYYGDGFGMRGGFDPENQHTFGWSQATIANAAVAPPHKLIRIRCQQRHTGSFIPVISDITSDLCGSNQIYAFAQLDQDHRLVVALLNSSSAQSSVVVPVWIADAAIGPTVTDPIIGDRSAAYVSDGTVGVNVSLERALRCDSPATGA